MATRSSILERSKKHETRISRYLWGHLRDWKECYDVSGIGLNGHTWYGEVKTFDGPRNLSDSMRLARQAGAQLVAAVSPGTNSFVVLHQTHGALEADTVFIVGIMLDGSDWRGPMTLAEFKQRYIIGGENHD